VAVAADRAVARASCSAIAPTTRGRDAATARASHPGEDRLAKERARLRARAGALGRRALAPLVSPVPPPARPLRTPRRHPRSVLNDRLQPDLPQAPTPTKLIVLGALKGLPGRVNHLDLEAAFAVPAHGESPAHPHQVSHQASRKSDAQSTCEGEGFQNPGSCCRAV